MGNKGDINSGNLQMIVFYADPLQITVMHLKDELERLKGGNQQVQRQWITCQRELIGFQASNSANSQLLQKKETEAAILAQRGKRLLHL